MILHAVPPAPDPDDGDAYAPPQDQRAEVAVLGSVMISRSALVEVVDTLTADDFYRPAHGMVWAAVQGLHAAGEPVDAITVADALTARGDLDRVGGAAWLHQSVAAVPTAANVGYYADIVRDRSQRRALLTALMRASQQIHSQTDTDAVRDGLLAACAATVPAANRVQHVRDVVPGVVAALADSGAGVFVPTAWDELNDLIGGWRPGGLYVAMAASGTGKSLFAAQAAVAVAQAGHAALVSSLEMTNDEIVMRFLSNVGRVNSGRLMNRRMEATDWDRVHAAAPVVADLPIYLDDTPGQSPQDVRRALLTVQAREPVGLAVVDYLQIMGRPKGVKYATRAEEIGAYSGELKNLAKATRTPILVPAQINRGPSSRADSRPTQGDLRESEKPWHDSDVVFALWEDPDPARAGEVDVIVLKNRFGPTGTVALTYLKHYSKMTPMGSGW